MIDPGKWWSKIKLRTFAASLQLHRQPLYVAASVSRDSWNWWRHLYSFHISLLNTLRFKSKTCMRVPYRRWSKWIKFLETTSRQEEKWTTNTSWRFEGQFVRGIDFNNVYSSLGSERTLRIIIILRLKLFDSIYQTMQTSLVIQSCYVRGLEYVIILPNRQQN